MCIGTDSSRGGVGLLNAYRGAYISSALSLKSLFCEVLGKQQVLGGLRKQSQVRNHCLY